MALSTEDLIALAKRVRKAADDAGELRPPRVGPLSVQLPDEIRVAISEDLKSGAYRQAADEAIGDDWDLQQL